MFPTTPYGGGSKCVLVTLVAAILHCLQAQDACVGPPTLSVTDCVRGSEADAIFTATCSSDVQCAAGSSYPVEWITPANNTERLQITTTIDNNTIITVLQIENATSEIDSGLYLCSIADGDEIRSVEENLTAGCIEEAHSEEEEAFVEEESNSENELPLSYQEIETITESEMSLALLEEYSLENQTDSNIESTTYPEVQTEEIETVTTVEDVVTPYQGIEINNEESEISGQDLAPSEQDVQTTQETENESETILEVQPESEAMIPSVKIKAEGVEPKNVSEPTNSNATELEAKESPAADFEMTPDEESEMEELEAEPEDEESHESLLDELIEDEKYHEDSELVILVGASVNSSTDENQELSSIRMLPFVESEAPEDHKTFNHLIVDSGEARYEREVEKDFVWTLKISPPSENLTYAFYRGALKTPIDLIKNKYSASFDSATGELTLTVKDLFLEDYGEYSVQIKSHDAEVAASTTLIVQSPPSVQDSHITLETEAGKLVTIPANILALNYQYFRQEKRILKFIWKYKKDETCWSMKDTQILTNYTNNFEGDLEEKIVSTVSFEAKYSGHVIFIAENEFGSACASILNIDVRNERRTNGSSIGIVAGVIAAVIILVAAHLLISGRRKRSGFHLVKEEEMHEFKNSSNSPVV